MCVLLEISEAMGFVLGEFIISFHAASILQTFLARVFLPGTPIVESERRWLLC